MDQKKLYERLMNVPLGSGEVDKLAAKIKDFPADGIRVDKDFQRVLAENSITVGDAGEILNKIRRAANPHYDFGTGFRGVSEPRITISGKSKVSRHMVGGPQIEPPFPLGPRDRAILEKDTQELHAKGMDVVISAIRNENSELFRAAGVDASPEASLFVELAVPPDHPLNFRQDGQPPQTDKTVNDEVFSRLQILLDKLSAEDRQKATEAIKAALCGKIAKCEIDFPGEHAGIKARLRRSTDMVEFEIAGMEIADMGRRPIALERPQGSALHRLKEAFHKKGIQNPAGGGKLLHDDLASLFDFELELFLIEHDWLSAFSKATDFTTGEFRLPFDVCVFEARVSGKRVIVRLAQDDDTVDFIYGLICLETSVGWSLVYAYKFEGNRFVVDPNEQSIPPSQVLEFQPVADYLAGQIRAICIALEAEVATTEIQRAPHKLNRQREKAGKLPIYDYHSVSLVRRHRVAPAETPAGVERAHPRLHFVRGHWRHYAASKTWIKWHLRGDPDLGFIDKHYRL